MAVERTSELRTAVTLELQAWMPESRRALRVMRSSVASTRIGAATGVTRFTVSVG